MVIEWMQKRPCSNLSLVFKKGQQYEPANYLPVSLTCLCCKMLEHVDRHNILTAFQYDFCARRSCEYETTCYSSAWLGIHIVRRRSYRHGRLGLFLRQLTESHIANYSLGSYTTMTSEEHPPVDHFLPSWQNPKCGRCGMFFRLCVRR